MPNENGTFLEKVLEAQKSAHLQNCKRAQGNGNMYLGHFYDKIPLENKDDFLFEDLAGVYIENGKSNMFAVCIHYTNLDELKTLPAGKYLCADCTDENKESKTN